MMGKTGKWFKSFLTGKKEKEKDQKSNNTNNNNNNNNNNGSIKQSTSSSNDQNPKTPVIPRPTTPKEKKRWSFRRSSASSTTTPTIDATQKTSEPPKIPPLVEVPPLEKLVQEVAADTCEVTNETVDVKEAANEVVPFYNSVDQEEGAALKIQAVFRSYLARKALKALRGLVKLQALVRGHLVRKQATATLRCMQALVTAQARARAQRIRSGGDEGKIINHRHSTHRRNSVDKIKHTNYYEMQDMEENIKIVEMDRGEYRSNINNRNSYSDQIMENNRMSTYQRVYTKQQEYLQQHSPAPSGIADMSPRTCSGHFEDYSFATAQSSPQCYSAVSRPDYCSWTPFSFPKPEYADTMSYDFPLYPNYMANTESSRAKVRSQSAPKQRPPEFERQPSRGRRPSVEGRNIPKGAKMQRSSSHVGSSAHKYHYPWSIKLDKSMVSLKDSECGSACSMATNAYYSRSVV